MFNFIKKRVRDAGICKKGVGEEGRRWKEKCMAEWIGRRDAGDLGIVDVKKEGDPVIFV